jgi:acyl carrier protein
MSESTKAPTPLETVIVIVSRTLQTPGTIAADSDLFALGANSVVMMSVVAQLEEAFDVEFDPEDLVKERLSSPRSIAQLLVSTYAVPEGTC